MNSPVRQRFYVVGAAILSLIGLSILGGCASFYPPLSHDEIKLRFKGYPLPLSTVVSLNERSFHYVDTGDANKPLVVFIHGSPGAWDAFEDFLKNRRLRDRARLISVDRPGYGRSGLGEPEKSLSTQAELISHVFKHNPSGQKAILVGHSFGGPVAAKMGIDHPNQVAGLVLVAPSVDPALEETKWYQIPAHWKLISWAMPRDLYSTNEEILALKNELKKLETQWKSLHIPITVIQGGLDKLVPKENADFVERVAAASKPKIQRNPELNHFIPWSSPELIVDAILELLSAEEPESTDIKN
ncbi:MAG: alpha/beta hydrolase [Verrucomicrobia bacterium]|nr:alpha/beta hydrolase [Verrucomicrobiota bacterium]